MSIEKKPDYIKLKKSYKGYFINDFEEDYYYYRAVIRLVNSYFKNPHPKKTHDIYNKLIILHRVFEKKYINSELINNCEDEFKQSYLKFLLNELFNSKYKVKFLEEHWENDIEFMKKNNMMCK
jgi:hypothetical protein